MKLSIFLVTIAICLGSILADPVLVPEEPEVTKVEPIPEPPKEEVAAVDPQDAVVELKNDTEQSFPNASAPFIKLYRDQRGPGLYRTEKGDVVRLFLVDLNMPSPVPAPLPPQVLPSGRTYMRRSLPMSMAPGPMPRPFLPQSPNKNFRSEVPMEGVSENPRAKFLFGNWFGGSYDPYGYGYNSYGSGYGSGYGYGYGSPYSGYGNSYYGGGIGYPNYY